MYARYVGETDNHFVTGHVYKCREIAIGLYRVYSDREHFVTSTDVNANFVYFYDNKEDSILYSQDIHVFKKEYDKLCEKIELEKNKKRRVILAHRIDEISKILTSY